MDPRPQKPPKLSARPPADRTRGAAEATVVRPVPDEPLTDADRFLSPPQVPGEVGRLGPYRVLGVLGRGGMGAVYRAEDPRLNRQVAVKVLLPDLSGDANAKARFRREAQAQAKVDHDNIINIYEVEEANGVAYIAMPLLKGQTLSDALRQNPRPPVAELVRIVREIAEGLDAAHAVDLIHRDIKPANIWLEDPKRRVKILDFGLARTATGGDDLPAPVGDESVDGSDDTDHLTARGAIMGTPAYMSPEQARGLPLDRRSDIFSLGVLLYQMATGRKPFNGSGAFDVMAAVATEEPHRAGKIIPELPPALDSLIHRMLAKNPADRPQSCAEVVDELVALARGLVVLPVVVPLGLVPGENIWEDLDTTVAETEPDDTETPRPEKPKLRPGASKWLWPALGGLGLVAALALLAVGLAIPWGKKDDPSAKAEEQKPKLDKPENPNKGKKDEKPAAPDQRAAAEWILKQQNGQKFTSVTVQRTGEKGSTKVLDAASLPKEPFTVTAVGLEHFADADESKLAEAFGAMGNLDRLAFSGPAWTDKRLTAALGALKGKKVAWLEVTKSPHQLVEAVTAMGGLSITTLEIATDAPDGFPLARLSALTGLQQALIGSKVSDGSLADLSKLSSWPSSLDFRSNPGLTDTGLAGIEPNSEQRRGSKINFYFGSGVSEKGANALADRFPEAAVVWTDADGKCRTIGPKGPERRKAAAAKVIARGGELQGYGPKQDFGQDPITNVYLSSGTYTQLNGEKADTPDWDVPRNGAVTAPFTDADLATLRDLGHMNGLYLSGQGFTDEGYAKLLAFPNVAGAQLLKISDCGAGDAVMPAVAGMKALSGLYLVHTKVTDAGVKNLTGRLPVIWSLRLTGSKGVTDESVEVLATLTPLRDLDLKGTGITPEGVKALAEKLPHTLIRNPDGTVREPKRKRLSRDEAAKELFARGAVVWNGGSTVTDPTKFDGGIVSIRFASGRYRGLAPPGNGWDAREETDGPVARPLDAAELVALFTDAKIGRFRGLYFHRQPLTDAGVGALCALPAMSTAYEVVITDCAVGDAAVGHLLRLPELESVYLNNTAVTDAGVRRLVEGRPLLTRLRLRDCGITNDSLADLARLTRLFELDLKGTGIDTARARDLADALPYTYVRLPDGTDAKRKPRPRFFYQSDRDKAVKLFLDRGAVLRVNGNPVTDPTKFGGTPSAIMFRLASGTYFDPRGPGAGWEKEEVGKVETPFDDADLLALVPDLRANDFNFISLNRQKVTDAGVVAFVTLPAVRTVLGLELIDCDVGDATAAAVAALPKLKDLYLNRTKVTSAGVKALLPRAEGLESLRLAFTAVDNAAIDDLIRFKRLEVLDLGGTKVTESGAKRLAAALPKCHIRDGAGNEFRNGKLYKPAKK